MSGSFGEFFEVGRYFKHDADFDSNYDDDVLWNISSRKKVEDKVYTYDEAINMTGNGWYNIGLLIVLSLAIQAMALDMFGFSYVVAAAACDLQFTHSQTSFLLTVPLIGAIASAYPWGYFSDTRGRKKSLTIALWGSFTVASLSALSPSFTILAILKFFSSALCSGAQSIAYTLLGESCSTRTKGSYMLIMTTSLMSGFAAYTAHAYFVLGLDFAYDLGFITFKPWRLLILTYSMTLGTSAALMHLFHESPKYLVNAGKTGEAVKILAKMKKVNRGCESYPVKKIILMETSFFQRTNVSFLRSLWEQTAPLFKPPLLQKTLVLFYITAVVHSVNNGFFLWIPVMFRSVFEESFASSKNSTDSFCDLIISQDRHEKSATCSSEVSLETFLMSITQGLIFTILNFGASRLAHRKKFLMILISMISFFCCVGMLLVKQKIINLILFFGVQINSISMGIVFSYFVELFPTSCRGMISCLGMMVARAGALMGVNLIGAFTFSNCTTSLYIWGAYIFSGALMAFLLPPDMVKKS